MSQHTELIDSYIAAWNETDSGRRADLIGLTWTEDARYLDPLMHGEGRDGIAAMIAGVQKQFPGLKFRRSGSVDAHNNCVRFPWELVSEEGTAVAGGVDFGVIRNGLLHRITGFIDFAPSATE
jgi:hypothetical protein